MLILPACTKAKLKAATAHMQELEQSSE